MDGGGGRFQRAAVVDGNVFAGRTQYLQSRLQLPRLHQAHLGVRRVMCQKCARRAWGLRRQLFFREWPGAARTFDIVARDGTGRSSTGTPRVQSTMVDSMPTSQAPPSSTSRSSPNSAATCWAVVGADAAKLVGAGGRDAPDRRVQLLAGLEHRMRHGVRGAAQAHAVLAAGRGLGGLRQARQDQGAAARARTRRSAAGQTPALPWHSG